MAMRPKTTGRDLPPKMLRPTKRLKNGTLWVGYYYNTRGSDGKQKEIPLGTDLNEAKRKWAELEARPAPAGTGLMRHLFDRYERDVLPTKAPRTQRDYLDQLRQLRPVFNMAPIEAITAQVIAQYRDRRSAKVRANREISLLSQIFNYAREWGYSSKENPCTGVRKNKEQPRDFYPERAVWDAVYLHACQPVRDAMDLAYLTGQRQADVLAAKKAQVTDEALVIRQGKTTKRLQILLNEQRVAGEPQKRNALGRLIDELMSRQRRVQSLYLVANELGQPLNRWTLRQRFGKARKAAAASNPALADEINAFQYRDIRRKSATDIAVDQGDIKAASELLGHTEEEITKRVYVAKGQKVRPTH